MARDDRQQQLGQEAAENPLLKPTGAALARQQPDSHHVSSDGYPVRVGMGLAQHGLCHARGVDDETTDKIYRLLRDVGTESSNMIEGWLNDQDELEFNLLDLQRDRATGTVELWNVAEEGWSAALSLRELRELVLTHLAASELQKQGTGIVGSERAFQLQQAGVRLDELERMGFRVKRDW